MAAVLDISIKVSRIHNAFKHTIQGRSSSKECICIPLEDLSVDQNGEIWINCKAWPEDKYEGQTHSLKQNLSEEQRKTYPASRNGNPMTPYVGTVKISSKQPGKATASAAPQVIAQSQNADSFKGQDPDLPF